MTKFKKISKSDKLYLTQGYFSNGHWLFKTEWIKSLKTRESLILRNKIKKMQLEIVTQKMNGSFIESRTDLSKVVSKVDLKKYSEFNLNDAEIVKGFKHGDASTPDEPVMIKLGKTHLDIEYSTALFFETDKTQVLNPKDPRNPVVILKANEIVGLVMPLNPEKLGEK